MSYSSFIFVDSPECIWSLEEESGTDIFPDSFISDPLYNGTYNTSKISRSNVPITIDGKRSIYNSTSASPGDTLFTIPSIGMFGAERKNKQHTLEFWMNLGIDTTTIPDSAASRLGESKIVGLSGSTVTGLYIRDLDYLVFKIGDTGKTVYESSVHIPNFNTPLHIAMIYYADSIQLIVNGVEGNQVIFIENPISSAETRNIEFKLPDKISSSSMNFSRVNYDTVSIYSIALDSSVLKRHYVYGLGKDVPGVLIKSLSGTQYGLNLQKTLPLKQVRYFNRQTWTNNVILNNLVINNDSITTKNFSPPTFSIFKQGVALSKSDMINSSNEIVFPADAYSYVEIPNYEGITGGATKKVEAKLSISSSHNNTSVEQTLMYVSSISNPSKYIVFRMKNRVISFYTSNSSTALFTHTVAGTGAAEFILSYYVENGTLYVKILDSTTSHTGNISANSLFPMQDAYIRFGSEPAFFGSKIPANITSDDIKRFDGSLLQVDIYDSATATPNFSSYPTRKISSMYQLYADGNTKRFCIATSGTFTTNVSLLDLLSYINYGMDSTSINLAVKTSIGSNAAKVKYDLVKIVGGTETTIESNKDIRNLNLPYISSSTPKIENLIYKITGTLYSSDVERYPGTLDHIIFQSYPTKVSSTKAYLEVASDNAGSNIRYYCGQTSTTNHVFKYIPEIDQTTDMHRSFFTGFLVGTVESGVSPYAMIPFNVSALSASSSTNKIYSVMFTALPYSGTLSNTKLLKIGTTEISIGTPEPSGVELYINGQRYDSGITYDFTTTTHFVAKFTSGIATPADIYFGYDSTASYFLDNISVFTQLLTTDQILELYSKFFSSIPVKVIAGYSTPIVGEINKTLSYIGAININDSEATDGVKKFQPLIGQSGFHPYSSCPNLASTANLAITLVSGSTYSFTYSGNKDLIKIDDTEMMLNDLILLKNQSTATQNGIYLVTAKTTSSITLVKQTAPTNKSLIFVKSGFVNRNYYFQKVSNTYTKQTVQSKIVSYDRKPIMAPKTFIVL